MAYTRICVAAALQRYVDSTPIAERLRDPCTRAVLPPPVLPS